MRNWRTVIFTLALGTLVASPSMAKSLEPGSIWNQVSLGPGFQLDSNLGGSSSFFMLVYTGEYNLQSDLALTGGLSLGLAGTIPVKTRFGVKYRWTGFKAPISPYARAELSMGQIIDAIGANLWFTGVRVAGGADYFLTGRLAAGVELGVDTGSTIHANNALSSIMDFLIHASLKF